MSLLKPTNQQEQDDRRSRSLTLWKHASENNLTFLSWEDWKKLVEPHLFRGEPNDNQAKN